MEEGQILATIDDSQPRNAVDQAAALLPPQTRKLLPRTRISRLRLTFETLPAALR